MEKNKPQPNATAEEKKIPTPEMGKCSCKKLNICNDIQREIIRQNDPLRFGHFTIKKSESPKINDYRKKCVNWLGIPSDILNFHIRKHHFSV